MDRSQDKQYPATVLDGGRLKGHDGARVQDCGPLDSEAMVMGVLDQSFDVLVLRYGVQKRVYCKDPRKRCVECEVVYEQFSRKLQAATPQAKRSARSEQSVAGLDSFRHRKVGKKSELTLLWTPEDLEKAPVEQVISIFTLVEVQLKADGAPMKYSAVLKRPEENES